MPAVPAFLATTAFSLGTIAVSYGALLKGALTVYGVVEANRQKRAARNAYEAALRNRTVVLRSNEAPRNIIYGNTRVAGVLTYACVYGDNNEYAYLLFTLADHPITAIDDVWGDNESVGALDGSGYVQSGSPWFKSDPQSFVQSGILGGNASTITLEHEPLDDEPLTLVGLRSSSDADPVELVEGQHFSLSGTTITLTTAAYAGFEYTLTYQFEAGGPCLKVEKFLGNATTGISVATLEANSPYVDGDDENPREWTSAHDGIGVAALGIEIKYDPDIFAGGIPNFSAIVRGKAVFDPRSGNTVYSRNAILCAADYIAHADGFAADFDTEIVDALVIEGANICDETVTLPDDAGTEPRYTCDGVVYLDAPRGDNLAAILSACAGSAQVSGGVWRILVGAYREPSMALDETDLATGPIKTRSRYPVLERFNAVRGQFIDPRQYYQLNDFEPYRSATYLTEDGETAHTFEDLRFPFTSSAYGAQRLARIALYKHRQSIIDQATYRLPAMALQWGDTVEITREIDGWEDKVFRVVETVLNVDTMNVGLTLHEEAAEIYDENFEEWTVVDPAPNTLLPNPRDVGEVQNAVVTSSATTYRTLGDGSLEGYAVVTFDPIVDSFVLRGGAVEIKWKRAYELSYRLDTVDNISESPRYEMRGVAANDLLNITLTVRNGAQVRGKAVNLVHRVSADLPVISSIVTAANHLLDAGMEYRLFSSWRPSDVDQFPPYGQVSNALIASPPSIINEKVSPDIGGYTHALDGPRPAKEIWAPNDVAVSPGQFVIGAVKVLPVTANAAMRLRFYDDQGAAIGGAVQGQKHFHPSGSVDVADRSTYERITVRAEAPANARFCRWSILFETNGTTAPQRATLYWTEPQCNVLDERLREGVTPVWQVGPTGTVHGAHIAANAATYVDVEHWDRTEIYTATTNSIVHLGSVTAVNDTDFAHGVVRVVGTYLINFPQNTSYALVIISEESLTAWPAAQNRWMIGRNLDDDHPIAVGSFVKEHRFTMGRGQKTFQIYACAGGVAITNGSCLLEQVVAGVEVIKK